ncbi:MAG: cyclic nucleotide-binding domain-containing protein [Rhodospirillaceae bacterium]|nr:cyclic nucleotide-binding domain-containing protein [Rhodospirillaceae bacterium]
MSEANRSTEIDRAGAGLVEMLGTILGRRSYTAGARIFAQGDAAEEAFAVLRGQVNISTINTRGRRVDLTLLGPGQFFGEMALLMHGPRSADAVAQTDCELLVLPRVLLDVKMAAASPFIRLWVETLAARVAAGSARVAADGDARPNRR